MKQKVKLMWTSFAAFVIFVVIISLSSCEKYTYVNEVINPIDTVFFQAQIQPIFNGICINCHSGSRNPDLRDGNSYNSLTSGGYVTLPAETSRLYRQIISGSHDSYTLPAEKQLVLIWIQQGALNN